MKVKKTKIKKTKARVIQKAKGKGPNININIDQSKRGGKEESSQRAQPQIITSFTPQYLPPPPQPYFNFPMPGPPANPFESAVRSTQARINEPINNELEKPKKEEPKPIEEDVFIPSINQSEPVQYIESFPVEEKIPIVKATPINEYTTSTTQTENPLTGVKETQTKNPMTAVIETQTEINRSIFDEEPVTNVFGQKIKFKGGKAKSMFDEDEEPVQLEIPVMTSAPRLKVREGFGVKPVTLDDLRRRKEGKIKPEKEKIPFENVKEGQQLGGSQKLEEERKQRSEERKKYFEELRNRQAEELRNSQAMEKEDIESRKMQIKPVILPPAPRLEIQPPKEEKTIETVLNEKPKEEPKGEPAEEILITPEELEKFKELTKQGREEEATTEVKPKKKLKSFKLPPASEETQLQNIEEQKQKQRLIYLQKTNTYLGDTLKSKGGNVTYKDDLGNSKRKTKEMLVNDLMKIYNPK